MKNKHTYEIEIGKVDRHCIFCNEEIPDEDFEFEDYFVVFRGFSKDCIKGFVCIDCYNHKCLSGIQEKRSKEWIRFILCPKCDQWEQMPMDMKRTHIQSFKWKSNIDEGDLKGEAVYECPDCKTMTVSNCRNVDIE